MTTPLHVRDENPVEHVDELKYGFLRKEEAHAAAFYRDLMELMRICHGATCFAAREGNRLAGFLILTMPGGKTIGPAVSQGFLWRAAAHALTGKYGLAPRLFLRGGGALFGFGSGSPGKRFAALPHVYVVVVAAGFTGRGIGTALQ